jgi:hypothetical protein
LPCARRPKAAPVNVAETPLNATSPKRAGQERHTISPLFVLAEARTNRHRFQLTEVKPSRCLRVDARPLEENLSDRVMLQPRT